MKILFVNEFGQSELKETEILPRIGDNVDMFYKPYPKVTSVLLYPNEDTAKKLMCELGCGCNSLQAIVTVS